MSEKEVTVYENLNLKKNLLTKIPEESVWLANFISPKTKLNYKDSVKNFISFHNITSPDQLRLIEQAHLISWRDSLIKNGATPKTVNNRISAISSLFKHLCEKQVCKINPTTGVRRPKVNVNEVKTIVITPEQVRSMLNAPDTKKLSGLRDCLILHILFFTGCRIAEVPSLKVKDYLEDAGYFTLTFTIKGGKTNKIAIHNELKIAIDKYLEKAGHSEDRESPLILRVQQKHLEGNMKVRQISNIFHKYAKKAGLPRGVTPHTSRATFITEALINNCPIESVQRSVGHSKIVTTQMYDKRVARHRDSASFVVRY